MERLAEHVAAHSGSWSGSAERCHISRSDARTRHVPVIFLTAKVALADSRRYLALGVSGFITKPFDALRLPAEISAIIDGVGPAPSRS